MYSRICRLRSSSWSFSRISSWASTKLDPSGLLPLDYTHDVKPRVILQLEAQPIDGEREDGLVQDIGNETALGGPVVVAALGGVGALREFLGDRRQFGTPQHLIAHLDDGLIRGRAVGELVENVRSVVPSGRGPGRRSPCCVRGSTSTVDRA